MDKRTIDGIRKYYNLPESSDADEYIEVDLKDSLGAAFVTLDIALDNFKKAIGCAVPNAVKKYFR